MFKPMHRQNDGDKTLKTIHRLDYLWSKLYSRLCTLRKLNLWSIAVIRPVCVPISPEPVQSIQMWDVSQMRNGPLRSGITFWMELGPKFMGTFVPLKANVLFHGWKERCKGDGTDLNVLAPPSQSAIVPRCTYLYGITLRSVVDDPTSLLLIILPRICSIKGSPGKWSAVLSFTRRISGPREWTQSIGRWLWR